MSGAVPTVKIKTENGSVDINLTDYDRTIHELADPEELKPLDPSKQETLFGSSKQPSTWTLNDGSVLQLGTVVQIAHERSGLSVEDWNKQPQDTIEEKIADVVTEMVPAEIPTGFKVGKNGKRGAASKFVIVDGQGKIFGADEYDSIEQAEAAIRVLNGEEAA